MDKVLLPKIKMTPATQKVLDYLGSVKPSTDFVIASTNLSSAQEQIS